MYVFQIDVEMVWLVSKHEIIGNIALEVSLDGRRDVITRSSIIF